MPNSKTLYPAALGQPRLTERLVEITRDPEPSGGKLAEPAADIARFPARRRARRAV